MDQITKQDQCHYFALTKSHFLSSEIPISSNWLLSSITNSCCRARRLRGRWLGSGSAITISRRGVPIAVGAAIARPIGGCSFTRPLLSGGGGQRSRLGELKHSVGGEQAKSSGQLVRDSLGMAGLPQGVVDVGHRLAGHPRVGGGGSVDVEGQLEVGVAVDVNRVILGPSAVRSAGPIASHTC